MTLQSGTRLGPYEIVGAIGAGGMGEVYRARLCRAAASCYSRRIGLTALTASTCSLPCWTRGGRFVLLVDVKEGSAPPTLTLVQNWFAEFAKDKR